MLSAAAPAPLLLRCRGSVAFHGAYQLRQEHQQQDERSGGDRDVHPRRLLHKACEIPELRDGKHRAADNIFIMDKGAVLGVIRVALGAKADDGGVALVRNYADDAVGGDRVLIEHEGDDVALPQREGVNRLDIYHGAGMIGRLHRTGEHREHLQPEEPYAHEQQRQQDRRDDQPGRADSGRR